ncbi:MFS transporter [Hyphomonas sp.]|jgi:MFS family permease|uniref:MFS transporter n=1 Tax=Hyphomonas sp. TaxID=87 RepID=UPI0025C2CA71|nr:MFS transporter [Hyphomonas sp.]MEE2921114.1 MFS transporter [Pseudomonadota bacterium]
MTDTRNVSAIILAVMILQIAGGLLGMLTPLGLEALGTSPQAIGGIAALYATGFMLGAWSAPAALASFGNIRLFAAAAAVTAAGSISLSLWYQPGYWALVRIVQGVSFAYMFTSVESWLGQAVPDKSRGSVMGIYHTGAKLSLMIGPFFVAGLSPLDSRAYSWAALFLSLALVPICLTQQEQPETPDRTAMPIGRLYRLAPAAVIGVAIAGVVNTGTLALLPIYFESFAIVGGGTAAAAVALAAAWLGGLVIQWPAGRLSDRIERRLVIAILAAVSGLAALVIAIFGRSFGEMGVIGVLVLWGGGALTFYGLCVAHAIDRTPKGKIPQVMSGLLFIWAGGSIVGPLLSGLAMRGAGAMGLFGLAGILLILLAFIMVWRVSARAAPEEHEQEDWSPILPTPLASVELDPRNPERESES